MTQSSGTTTDLQLKCNFRWILFANHIEPVRGFLGRQLRRKLLAQEVETRLHNTELYQVIEWITKSFVMINKFLESHCSQDATLSPATFLGLPLDQNTSRLWFINLWNLNIGIIALRLTIIFINLKSNHGLQFKIRKTFCSLLLELSPMINLVPHVLDSVREGLILYGKRSSWDDPVKVMRDTWPWSSPASGLEVSYTSDI